MSEAGRRNEERGGAKGAYLGWLMSHEDDDSVHVWLALILWITTTVVVWLKLDLGLARLAH